MPSVGHEDVPRLHVSMNDAIAVSFRERVRDLQGETETLIPGKRTSLSDLIADPAARARLGRAGAHRVHAEFGAERSLDDLANLFGVGYIYDFCTLNEQVSEANSEMA